MAKQKKPVHRVEMTEGKRNIIRQLLEEYDIETAEDIQDALKDLLGGTIKEMMEAIYSPMQGLPFFKVKMDCTSCLAVQKTKQELFDEGYVIMNNSSL